MAIAQTSGTASLATLGVRGDNQQVENLGAGISQLLNTAQEVSSNTPNRVGGAAEGANANGADSGASTEAGTLASPTDPSRGQNLDIIA